MGKLTNFDGGIQKEFHQMQVNNLTQQSSKKKSQTRGVHLNLMTNEHQEMNR